MNIELKEINKDTLKVGDIVGVARDVSCGWSSSFRHQRIYSAKVTRITPKRTKFFTDKFGEHDKRETFYEPDSNAVKENHLAMLFDGFQRGVYGNVQKALCNSGIQQTYYSKGRYACGYGNCKRIACIWFYLPVSGGGRGVNTGKIDEYASGRQNAIISAWQEDVRCYL